MLGGALTGAASLLHIAIIIGGPRWYRFFGAGERMARLAASGSLYPAVVTSTLAVILAVWALYALSGAGFVRPLPFLRLALAVIAAVYLIRGILGIPLILVMDDPYSHQLKAKMTFMIVSSAFCIMLGICYAIGTKAITKRSQP